MIGGLGVDLVDIDRLEKIVEKWGYRFLRRIFTNEEIQYCRSRSRSAGHFAARFAAKEAYLKSLGLGLFAGVGLQDVEVIVLDTGKPELRLHGPAREMFERRGMSRHHLSLSHSNRTAAAVVILEKEAVPGR